MKFIATTTAAIALSSTAAFAAGDHSCAHGKTLTDGTLTIATGNPAYYPWVMNDAPESGEGFEAAVAYAIAQKMGFSSDQVTWVRTSFDEAIQPGAKNFDFNMQQYSITPEREEMVDFSLPYYSSAMAILTTQSVIDGGASATMESLKALKWGAVATTTATPMLSDVIQPDSAPLLYNDNADVNAALAAGQIDAAIYDLPTALYLSAVVVDGGAILGQFPAEDGAAGDQFGLLMEDGNPLKECVDAAIAELTEGGELAAIEATWLAEATGVPVIAK